MGAPAEPTGAGHAAAAATGEHFRWPVRVYWEDTDAGGIVFYANYLKFFERARTEWLRGLAPSQESLRRASQGMFVVSETAMRYLSPARLDDELSITVRLGQVGRASLLIHQQAWCGERLLVNGEVRIGWVQPDQAGGFKPARMPADIVACLPQPMLGPGQPGEPAGHTKPT